MEFKRPQENILFSTYFRAIQELEGCLIAFYSSVSSDIEALKKITQDYSAMQHSYVERSTNLMVHEFIRANRPYIPLKNETIGEYVKNRKNAYFDVLDITNPVLQASGFLTDKLTNSESDKDVIAFLENM